LFAYEHFGIVPDVMTLAKALGNGLPIGAMLAREEMASAFSPGAHATTFGGTPIITAAALAVVKTMAAENITAHSAQVGSYFKKKLQSLQKKHPIIEDVRGYGLLIGMELKVKGDGVVKACLEKGFLVNCIQESILRFAPPLIVQKTDIDALVDCLDEVFSEMTV
jgi:acetylornithine/N-succinyldiaminopimelate aminotransferase